MLWSLFAGLVIGLVIAFGVVWLLNKSPLPFQDKPVATAPVEAVPGALPAPLPGKPGDKPREKTQLDFYNILEGKQPVNPDKTANGTNPPVAIPSDSASPAAPVDVFFLQVGAFQKTQDVDNLKAKLALMGMDASVQEVTIADKGVMQRVRVGPFRSPEEMNRARTTLAQGGVQTTVIKQKETPAR